MTKTSLKDLALGLASPWRSTIVGKAGGATLKVLRMDDAAYPEEVHDFDEALLVIDGQLRLDIEGRCIEVEAGELYIVPAGQPHAVAPGSRGTLVIIDR